MINDAHCHFFSEGFFLALASRLLFGTDSSFFPRGWQKGVYEAQKQVLDGMKMSASDQALVFGGNFDRLFGGG